MKIKTTTAQFRLTEKDKAAICRDAAALGMTISEYIRGLHKHMRVPFAKKMRPDKA